MGEIIPFPELRYLAPATGPESYLAPIDRAATEYPPFKGRILGCRVLLVRIEENITHSGRFVLPDTYKHGSVMFRVLAVGPGEFVKQGKKRLWIQPEVTPGDCVVSRHWTQSNEPRTETWHAPQYLDDCGGAGRVIVDVRFCEISWPATNKQLGLIPQL